MEESTKTSDTLLAGLNSGQAEAWERAYHRYAEKVICIIMNRGHNFHAAQDIFQEIIVEQAQGKITKYDQQKGRLGSWLTAFAIRKAQNWWRKNYRVESYAPEEFPNDALDEFFAGKLEGGKARLTPDGAWLHKELQQELEEAYARVRARSNNSDMEIYLEVVRGKKAAEVARQFDRPTAASVHAAVFRARQALRVELEHLRPRRDPELTIPSLRPPGEFFERLKFLMAVRKAMPETRVRGLIVWAPPRGPIERDTLQIQPVNQGLTVGRDAKKSRWTFPDQEMSKGHFIIEPRGRDFWLKDWPSRNGTYRNHFEKEKRVDEALLADGDVIGAGSQKFVFVA